MSDLNQPQSVWDDLLHEKFIYAMLAPLRELREISDKFGRTREQVRVTLSAASFFVESEGPVTLLGAHPGVNAQPDDSFFVRFTGNAGARVVSVYTNAGASGLVAQAAAVADGNLATLVEQNSSGLSGTWFVPATSANTVADELTVRAYPDWQAITRRVFPESGVFVDDDAHAARTLQELYQAVSNGIDDLKEAFKSGLSRVLLTDGDVNPQSIGNFFTVTNLTTFLTERVVSTNGAVTRPRTGWLPTLSEAMADETNAGAQSVVRTVPTGAAGVFDGGNTGLGAVASHTPSESCPGIKVDFDCDQGADNDRLGVERFSARITFTDPGDERTPLVVTGPTIKQPWKGPFGFGPITITRTLTKTGDGSDLRFTAASNAVVTNETNDNTDDGVLHWQIVANASNWDISFYKSSSLAVSELVAKATNIATSAVFSATQQNNSNLQVDWQLGGTPSAVSGTLLLNPFRIDRGDDLPDSFSVTVSLAADPGLVQTLVSEEFNASLNSAALGAETADDGYAKAGTFSPYAVQDN
jgi:hypothetical protein